MARLTPGQTLQWDNCDFVFNPTHEGEADFWIVFASARPLERCRVAPHNTLFIAGEPPAKKIYPQGFYRQFAHLVDTHNAPRHASLHLDALGLPWSVGLDTRQHRYVYGYDELKALPPPVKQNRISAVCSNTAQTPGQRQRLAFLAELQRELGDHLVHFGRGFTPLDDKMEGIKPYRFHLALENSQSQHYWTEKVTDAYLGWAFPLYVGCPNLSDYFSSDSFRPLDMSDVPATVKIIRRLLEQPDNASAITALKTARDQVLDVYNPFARFSHWVNRFYRPGTAQPLLIRDEKAFRFLRGWFYRLKNRK